LYDTIIEKKSPVVVGAAVSTTAYDPATKDNQTFLKRLADVNNNVTTELQQVWLTEPLAATVRAEEFLMTEKKRLSPIYRNSAYKKRDRTNSSPGFNNGVWSEKEVANIEEGIKKYG